MGSSVLIPQQIWQRIFRNVIIALVILLPAAVFGQAYYGTVSGILTDSSGAMVQSAHVVLTDEQKGYKFTTQSDKEGRYLFVAIPPGLYSVTVEVKGFEKSVRTHVRLNVTENATADMTLKIAGGSQSVDVKAQTETLHTEDAVTGEVIDRRAINDLPLINRNVQDLIYLTPGVTDMSDANSVMDTNGTNFVSNGSRGASADILTDGSSVTNFEPNGGITYATYVESPEAIDEFKVQQSNFSAEYGFSGASIVNMITRSGTNKYHGEVYDFIRNTITDANSWFNNETSTPLPPVHRNDFGGTIGGPIVKNKTFFFFDWDGTLESSMNTYQAGVPSAAMRTGDFGEICTSQGGSFDSTGMCMEGGAPLIAGQLYDPYSGVYNSADAGPVRNTFIPNNRIDLYTSPGNPNLPGNLQPPPGPGNLIDPVARKVMGLFPLPTPNMPNASLYDNWIASGATPYNNQQFDIRIDHRFNQKNLLSAKYSQDWNSTTPFNCFKTFIDPCGSGQNKGTAHLFAINDTHTFSP